MGEIKPSPPTPVLATSPAAAPSIGARTEHRVSELRSEKLDLNIISQEGSVGEGVNWTFHVQDYGDQNRKQNILNCPLYTYTPLSLSHSSSHPFTFLRSILG